MFIQGKQNFELAVCVVSSDCGGAAIFRTQIDWKSYRSFTALVLVSVYLGVILYGGFGFLGPVSAFLIYIILKECDVLKEN